MRTWIEKAADAVEQCRFLDYTFAVRKSTSTDAVYLQATYDEADVTTGLIEKQFTRRWNLSPTMTKSEIVSTAFKCAITSMEHRTREWFYYRGRPIYHPHYDVDDLHAICDRRDVRSCSGGIDVTSYIEKN